MKIIDAAILAGLLFVSSQARAQVTVGTQQASIVLGITNPLSDTNLGYGESETFGQTGPAVGFNYLYQFQPNFSVGGDYDYKFLGTQNYPEPHGGASVQTSAWTLLGVVRADLLPQSRLRPYGLVGLGIGGASRTLSFPFSPQNNWEGNSTGVAFALGAGMDFDINSSWLVGGELRYSIIDTDAAQVGVGSVSMLDVLFKLGYKFGR